MALCGLRYLLFKARGFTVPKRVRILEFPPPEGVHLVGAGAQRCRTRCMVPMRVQSMVVPPHELSTLIQQLLCGAKSKWPTCLEKGFSPFLRFPRRKGHSTARRFLCPCRKRAIDRPGRRRQLLRVATSG